MKYATGFQNVSRGFLASGLVVLVSILHYATNTNYHQLHEFLEHLYYVPILMVAFWHGPKVGMLFALFASILYMLHVELDWADDPGGSFDQYMHMLLYHLFALLVGVISQKSQLRLKRLERLSSDLLETNEDLRKTSALLSRTDRLAALGELSAGIAHEIRNPLGSIKGSIEILAREIPAHNPKYEFVEIIRQEASRLNHLVSEFLRFARPPKPAIVTADVNQLVEASLNLLRPEAQGAQIEIVWERNDRLPHVNVDKEQIRQVLLNILLNSIQAMPGGGLMRVSTHFIADQNQVAIEIRDSGDGCDSSQLESIFDPFFTTKPQGTGLGLSISHQLVKNHGGMITASANRDRGLTFCVALPLDPTSEAA